MKPKDSGNNGGVEKAGKQKYMKNMKKRDLFLITHSSVKLFVGIVIVLSLIGSHSGAAQKIKLERILGKWAGTIVTQFEGERDETRVEFEFNKDRTVKLTMVGTQIATYKINGGNISVDFDNNLNEPFILKRLRVTDEKLLANLQFRSDLTSSISHVRLTRVHEEKANEGLLELTCNNLDLRPSVRKVFNKYQVQCPIDIGKNTNWYNVRFFKMFMSELVSALMSSEQKSPLDSEPYADVSNGQVYVVLNKKKQSQAEEDKKSIAATLKPLFRDIERVRFIDVMPAYGHVGDAGVLLGVWQINSAYRAGPFIDYDRVWNEVFNTALKLNIRLDSSTEVKLKNNRSVRQLVPRKIGQSEGFHYFEKVNVTMTDPFEQHKYLVIAIESDIFKRKGYSSYKQSVSCVLNNPMTEGSFNAPCSEMPYLNAVIKALLL